MTLPLSRVLTPQEEHILAAQFQHVLDVRERELENPNTPDQPAYLQLIEQAVQSGLNVPEPSLLIEQSPSQFYQPLVPITMAHQQPLHQQQHQQAAPAPAAPAAPAAPLTGQMNGTPPDTFTRKRANVDTFMQQWELYQTINDEHVNIQNPFKQVVTALHFIRGPNVNDWVEEQLTDLMRKVTITVNPIAHTSESGMNSSMHSIPRSQT